MKTLVATRRSQGDRGDDYMYAVPGELVWLTWICDRDRMDPAHGCGCGRAFGGLSSHKATTTAEVVETEMTEDELRLAFETSLREQGWIPAGASTEGVEEILAETLSMARAIAEAVPVGAVVRRDFDHIHAQVLLN